MCINIVFIILYLQEGVGLAKLMKGEPTWHALVGREDNKRCTQNKTQKAEAGLNLNEGVNMGINQIWQITTGAEEDRFRIG